MVADDPSGTDGLKGLLRLMILRRPAGTGEVEGVHIGSVIEHEAETEHV